MAADPRTEKAREIAEYIGFHRYDYNIKRMLEGWRSPEECRKMVEALRAYFEHDGEAELERLGKALEEFER